MGHDEESITESGYSNSIPSPQGTLGKNIDVEKDQVRGEMSSRASPVPSPQGATLGRSVDTEKLMVASETANSTECEGDSVAESLGPVGSAARDHTTEAQKRQVI